MGWNETKLEKQHPITEGFDSDPRFYFVHSYYVSCDNSENILMTTKYGNDFTSGIISDNIIGLQFHPEKSHKFGMKIFKNFIEKC